MTTSSPLNLSDTIKTDPYENTDTTENDPYLSLLSPDYPQWIAFLILETVFLIFGVYLLVAVIFFTIKNMHEWKNPSYPGCDKVKRFRKYLLILLILYALSSLFKFALAQWIYWGPPVSTSREHCAVFAKLYQVSHSISTVIFFLFLWLRQHTLQQGPSYLTAPSHCIIRFSWALLGIIIVGGIAATVGVFFSNSSDSLLYVQGTNACSRGNTSQLNTAIVFTGYMIVVIMQACILVMFILALRRSNRGMQTAKKKRRSTVGSNTSINRVHKIIKNCSIATAISMASNVTVVLVYTIATKSLVQLVSAALYDFDSAINLGSIVFCFSNWKELLLPWPCFNDRFKTKNELSSIGMLTLRKQHSRSIKEEGSKDLPHSHCNVLTTTDATPSKTLG